MQDNNSCSWGKWCQENGLHCSRRVWAEAVRFCFSSGHRSRFVASHHSKILNNPDSCRLGLTVSELSAESRQRCGQACGPWGLSLGLGLFHTSSFYIVCSPGIFPCLALNVVAFLLFTFFLWVIHLLLFYQLPFLHWLSDQHFTFSKVSSGRFLLPETLEQNPNSSSSSLTNSPLSRVVSFSGFLLQWCRDAPGCPAILASLCPHTPQSAHSTKSSPRSYSVSSFLLLSKPLIPPCPPAIGLTAASPTGSSFVRSLDWNAVSQAHSKFLGIKSWVGCSHYS